MSTFPGGFVPVAPPADGLALAFAAARRRRQRKAGAAGAAGLLAAVALLASMGSGGERTLLQEPVPPANHPALGVLPGGVDSGTAATSAPVARTAQGNAPAAPRIGAAAPPLRGDDAAGGDSGTSAPGGGRVQATSTKPISGPMRRSSTILYTNGDLVCPARKQQQRQRGLCTDVYVTGSGSSTGVVTIVAEICNVGTQTELLSFDTAREVDVAVRQSGVEVWRWSLGRRFAATPHEMTVPTQECVMWSTDWRQVDSHGAPVKEGTYQVVADLDADEVAGPDRHPSSSMTVSSQS